MSDEKPNLLAAFPHQVERVYITRGDNGYNHHGHKCDKAAGVKIDGKIYWLAAGGIAYLTEVRQELSKLNVTLYDDKYGVLDEKNYFKPKTVTRIGRHIEDVFHKDSFYIKNCVRKECGSIWWTSEELVEKFFT